MDKALVRQIIKEYDTTKREKCGNEVIIERLDNLIMYNSNAHAAMNKHLEDLNGKVAKHELFNAKIKVYLSIAGFIIMTTLGIIIEKIIR